MLISTRGRATLQAGRWRHKACPDRFYSALYEVCGLRKRSGSVCWKGWSGSRVCSVVLLKAGLDRTFGYTEPLCHAIHRNTLRAGRDKLCGNRGGGLCPGAVNGLVGVPRLPDASLDIAVISVLAAHSKNPRVGSAGWYR